MINCLRQMVVKGSKESFFGILADPWVFHKSVWNIISSHSIQQEFVVGQILLFVFFDIGTNEIPKSIANKCVKVLHINQTDELFSLIFIVRSKHHRWGYISLKIIKLSSLVFLPLLFEVWSWMVKLNMDHHSLWEAQLLQHGNTDFILDPLHRMKRLPQSLQIFTQLLQQTELVSLLQWALLELLEVRLPSKKLHQMTQPFSLKLELNYSKP